MKIRGTRWVKVHRKTVEKRKTWKACGNCVKAHEWHTQSVHAQTEDFDFVACRNKSWDMPSYSTLKNSLFFFLSFSTSLLLFTLFHSFHSRPTTVLFCLQLPLLAHSKLKLYMLCALLWKKSMCSSRKTWHDVLSPLHKSWILLDQEQWFIAY